MGLIQISDWSNTHHLPRLDLASTFLIESLSSSHLHSTAVGVLTVCMGSGVPIRPSIPAGSSLQVNRSNTQTGQHHARSVGDGNLYFEIHPQYSVFQKGDLRNQKLRNPYLLRRTSTQVHTNKRVWSPAKEGPFGSNPFISRATTSKYKPSSESYQQMGIWVETKRAPYSSLVHGVLLKIVQYRPNPEENINIIGVRRSSWFGGSFQLQNPYVEMESRLSHHHSIANWGSEF